MDTIEDQIMEILEPRLQFYRTGPDDNTRYFVGPEVLVPLTWMASAIALPILLTAANEAVKIQVKKFFDKEKGEKDVEALLSEIKSEKDKSSVEIGKMESEEAMDEVASYLSHRGWPATMAKADAAAIISILRRQL